MLTYLHNYETKIEAELNRRISRRTPLFQNFSLIRLLLFLILLFWCIGFTLRSIFPDSAGVIVFSPLLKKIYSSVCYQDNLKTFSISGEKLFVCVRCTGIYLGALVFSFISIFLKRIRISRNLFIAGLSAIIADVLIYSPGIFNYSKYFAFVTGFFFGSVAFLYILIILEKEFFKKEK